MPTKNQACFGGSWDTSSFANAAKIVNVTKGKNPLFCGSCKVFVFQKRKADGAKLVAFSQDRVCPDNMARVCQKQINVVLREKKEVSLKRGGHRHLRACASLCSKPFSAQK